MADKIKFIFYHILSLLCFRFWDHAAAAEILKQGDVLNSSTSASLVSENGFFILRFYNLSVNEWYLSIWYEADTEKPCWVANRDRPLKNGSVALLIDENGNLLIKYTGGDPIKLYSGQPKTNVSAVLQDNGNFVLREAEQILWQSFDYPTDTFLSGMKLGINRKTGQNWSLTSWFASSIPTPGAFTLEWIPLERQLVVNRRGERFWSSGVLNKIGFDNLDICCFNEVSNEDEEYLTLKLKLDGPSPGGADIASLSLRYDGNIVTQISSEEGMFPRVSIECEGNRRGTGCERWQGPKCRRAALFQRKLLVAHNITDSVNNASLSLSDCKDICWKNCSCFGTKSHNLDGTGCVFFYRPFEDITNGTKESVHTIFEDITNGTKESVHTISYIPSGGKNECWISLLVTVAGVFVIGIFLVILFLLFVRWRRAHIEGKFLLELMNESKELQIEGKKGFNLKVYRLSSIKNATNCFSDKNELGKGGYGPVYKGLLDGQEIAIKRLSRSSRQGLTEFKNELIIVAKLQHTNLVQLLGFCIQGEEKMLVYEYMPNNSLDSYIFDQTKRNLFNWSKSFNIIGEIAQGLLYLHKYSRLPIIHRDLKTSNILLDKNMNPKISDFGMARIFTTTQSETKTNRIAGTRGYMSPEYAVMRIYSTKSDVFSFGVLIFEIVSGRRSNSNFNFDRPLNLIGYAWMLWKENSTLELMHPMLRDSCSEDQVLRCINVALLCVEDDPLDRPSMGDVISMLTSEGVKLPMPKQPAFCIERRIAEVKPSSGGMAENRSINNLTLSAVTGR